MSISLLQAAKAILFLWQIKNIDLFKWPRLQAGLVFRLSRPVNAKIILSLYPMMCHYGLIVISTTNGGEKKIPQTKIELNCSKITKIQGLDEFAKLIFPGNRDHQSIFLAIFIEIKYAPGQFIPLLKPLCERYSFSPRMLETVRSKMRRMGIIDHVSRFNKVHGYREGWVFSSRFSRSLSRLSELAKSFRDRTDSLQEKKDRDLFLYL